MLFGTRETMRAHCACLPSWRETPDYYNTPPWYVAGSSDKLHLTQPATKDQHKETRENSGHPRTRTHVCRASSSGGTHSPIDTTHLFVVSKVLVVVPHPPRPGRLLQKPKTGESEAQPAPRTPEPPPAAAAAAQPARRARSRRRRRTYARRRGCSGARAAATKATDAERKEGEVGRRTVATATGSAAAAAAGGALEGSDGSAGCSGGADWLVRGGELGGWPRGWGRPGEGCPACPGGGGGGGAEAAGRHR